MRARNLDRCRRDRPGVGTGVSATVGREVGPRWGRPLGRSDLVGDAGDGLVGPAAVLGAEGAAGDGVDPWVAVERAPVRRGAPPAVGDLRGGPEAVVARAGQHFAARLAAEAAALDVVPARRDRVTG